MSGTVGFLDAVALRPLTRAVAEPPRTSAFTATTQPVPWPKAYGGDLLAQAAAAATMTVTADRTLHAMHSVFVAPAAIGADLRYDVETLRDGRSYSSRRVLASADGAIVFTAICSFHTGESSDVIAAAMPVDVPPPDEVPSSAERVAHLEGAAARYWADGRSFDVRHIGEAHYDVPAEDRAPEVRLWIRALGSLPDDPALHRLALIYVCDYAMLEPVLKAQGLAWADTDLVTASLDHSMWLHADARLDDWVLCTLTATSFAHGRALVRGEFHTRGGVHLASVAQQGMIRRRSAR
ncbi:MAG: acyl-CoA thioesterase II [Microbacterium sp.]|uniref:acyl-CoA thioesterase n=1 Tax=Microbacterium sp. TaxID=51671 RepID=UPI000DAF9D22|nr:acyl-CoA thioesterase domain-containing protein [Microbacterium sp.]PZU37231.1 MAG: acyl-CoA thioesterase II [Microbacterium sp.]